MLAYNGAVRISGITIAFQALENGYPVVESLASLLPLCDEVVVNCGASTDGTQEAVRGLGSAKVRLLEEPWDLSLRDKGLLLSRETNRAMDACTGDWVIYLQADEVLHERDAAGLLTAIREAQGHRGIDGISFRYLHFYGSPAWVQDNPFGWYARAVRTVRRDPAIRSVGDALKFRRTVAGRPRRVRAFRSRATVYHYGWARPPEVMLKKQRHLDRFWHSDAEVDRAWAGVTAAEVYRDTAHLVPFRGTHPAVMAARVVGASWAFTPPARPAVPRWVRLAGEMMRRAAARLAGKPEDSRP